MNRLISIGELAELKGISVDTIRRWEKEGKLESVRTDSGHRRYRLSDFVEEKAGKTIADARVSSHDSLRNLFKTVNIQRSKHIERSNQWLP